jgi:hypothetical protein
MMEALSSSETSVLTRVTRRNIPEDAILHSHCSENLKYYKVLDEYVIRLNRCNIPCIYLLVFYFMSGAEIGEIREREAPLYFAYARFSFVTNI